MELIEVNRTKTDLKQQLSFLIKREFITVYGKYFRLFYLLAGITAIVLAISFFTSADSFIVLKAWLIMMTAIIWAAGGIFLITIFIRWIKRRNWSDKVIKAFLNTDSKFYIAFNEEKFTFVADTFKSDIKWEFYKYYAEDNTSIYFFPEKNLYEAVYFSPNDIGGEYFEQLKLIAKAKLMPLL